MIYLDYAATTPMDPEVKKAMEPYFSDKFGNPSSLHFFGQEAMATIDRAREKIAKIINADFREIIFTGSATEANNLALRGVVKVARLFSDGTGRSLAPAASVALDLSSRRQSTASTDRARRDSETFRTKTAEPLYRIIVSKIEHESILETARDLSTQYIECSAEHKKNFLCSGFEKEGVEVIYLPVDCEGIVDLKKLKESLNERTVLVSIMHANNETGTIQPIAEIAKIINDYKKENGKIYPLFHADAVQAFQFLDCDVDKLEVDLMTLSAHKIYGPKGMGMLYCRALNPKPCALSSIITGGGQEFGLRSGTENVPAIIGFAKAVELAAKNREKETKRIFKLSDYFFKEIKKIFSKAEINGITMSDIVRVKKLPNILNIYFPNQKADELLMKLDLSGVAVSSGSACSARASKISHVLKAMNIPENKIKSSLRFSFGKFTTKKELSEAIKIIRPFA